MKKISFLFGVHIHQPVGNFEWVLESAHDEAYFPFLEILERHPGIRITFHSSGNLLEWLLNKKPAYAALLGRLVRKGQIELVTGGFYEPILSAIGDSDKSGQILKLSRFIQDKFESTPDGMWLAERVWEPSLAKPLHEAGINYTFADDSHFISAGIPADRLHGYFVTEEDGHPLNIFPISKKLRYMIPFHAPEECIRYIGEMAEKSPGHAAMVADDGEKFGVWPGTNALVYKNGWLEKFFSLIEENSNWISSVQFGEYMRTHKPSGRVYLPAASYTEMMEWALPAESQSGYVSLVERLKNDGSYDKCAGFVHGAMWRNFLVRYPESNRLHKRVLFARGRLEELRDHRKISKTSYDAALDRIWMAQVNCPYWHGVFGGLYLPHLRENAYSNLFRAETLMSRVEADGGPEVSTHVADINKDGLEEILVETKEMSILVEPENGGGIFELGWRKHGFNFANGLTRRFEAYHNRLNQVDDGEPGGDQEVRTIHSDIRSKEAGLGKKLFYDRYQRGCLLDHFLDRDGTPEEFEKATFRRAGGFARAPYSFSARGTRDSSLVTLSRTGEVEDRGHTSSIEVTKRIFVDGSHPFVRFEYEILNCGPGTAALRFGTEFNLTFPERSSGKGMIRFSGNDGGDRELMSRGEVPATDGFVIHHPTDGPVLELNLEAPGKIWRFPVETVSLSESGLERVFQCLSVMPVWDIVLSEGKTWQTKLTLRFTER